MTRKAGWATMIIVNTLLTASVWTGAAWAEPQRLNCVLTDSETHPGSESRAITVTFDEDKKTLTAEADGHSFSFTKVTITYISISGQADHISLGVDRSSLGIVWQQYGTDKVATEYGHCRPQSSND